MRARTILRIIAIAVLCGALLAAGGCKPARTARKKVVRPLLRITKKTLKGSVRTAAKMLKTKRAHRVAVSVVKKTVLGDAISFNPNDAAMVFVEALLGDGAAQGIELLIADPKDIVEGKLKDTVTHYLIIEPLETLKRKRDGGDEDVARYRATLKDAANDEVVAEEDIEIVDGGNMSDSDRPPAPNDD